MQRNESDADIQRNYQEYARTVYKYLLSLTRDEQTAEELTQETFFQAIKSCGKYDGSCSMPTWLCAIAKNVLRTYRRKHPQQENIDDIREEAFSTPSAEEGAEASDERVRLFRRLHELPEPYREVLYLRIYGGLSFREIGEVHSKTENWARVTFYRGKEKLKDTLGEEKKEKKHSAAHN